MRISTPRSVLLLLLSPALLLACGSSGGGPLPFTPTDASDTSVAQSDTSVTQDDAVEGPNDTIAQAQDDTQSADDVATQQDTGGGAVTPSDCDHDGFTPVGEQFGELQAGVSVYQAANSESDPYDLLSFEFYTGGGYAGATGPGTYDLNGSNYETCSNCVLVRSGCTQSGECAKTFYADTGALIIDHWSVDDGFSGHLEGVTLKEVTIDETSFHSTPVANGDTWCLDAHTFSTTVTPPLTGGENTQDTCVAAGNGTLIHDNIADFSLPNCNGDMVSIHAGCGDDGALMLIGTAGWCSACEAELSQIVADHGGALSRAAVANKTPGLDMLIILGEDQQSAKPTQAYCLAYAQGLGIDPAMVLIDNDPAGKQIPLIEPAGYGIDANSFATVWTNMNPYLREQGGEVVTSTPWMMLLKTSNMEYWWNDTEGPGTLEQALGELLP